MSPYLFAGIAVCANVLLWLAVYWVQADESRRALVPPRSAKFLYLQDWHTGSWGDLIGLSLVDAALGVYLSHGSPSILVVALAAAAGAAFAAVFHLHRLSPRYPGDAGYPRRGTVSRSGRVHLGYVILQSMTVALVAELLVLGRLPGAALYLAIAGGALYAASAAADYQRLRWRPRQHP